MELQSLVRRAMEHGHATAYERLWLTQRSPVHQVQTFF